MAGIVLVQVELIIQKKKAAC